MNFLLFFIAVVFNAWFVSLISQPISLVCIFVSCVFLLRQPAKGTFFIASLCLLTFLQLRVNTAPPLLTNDALSQHSRFQQMRAYPALSIPIAYWVEERPELRQLGALVDRSSILFSPNYYFFANHPRARPAVTEIEKFPVVLLPFSVLGILISIKKRRKILLLPLVLAMITGMHLPMFPVIAATIYEGLTSVFVKYDRKFFVFVIFFIISLFIQYVFANY